MQYPQWSVSAGQPPYAVTLIVRETPGSLLAELYGGTRPHLGAWAAAGEGAEMTSGSFAGHKEEGLARALAQRLHEALGLNVVAVSGIHVDRATRAEIELLSANAGQAGEKALERLLSRPGCP